MRIVLVRPRDPNNIGAAARAMANFGFSDLVVVAPHPPVWEEVRSAIGAGDVIEGARVVATLAEAVADCRVVAGTTAATRRRLASVATPAAFFEAEEASRPDLALVFGNEKHGLTAEDLERCHTAIHIPTTARQPSLNLAHAVAICCYEAARGGAPEVARSVAPPRRRDPVAPMGEVDAFLSALEAASALRTRAPQARSAGLERLRSLLLRARATRTDLSFLRGLLAPSKRR